MQKNLTASSNNHANICNLSSIYPAFWLHLSMQSRETVWSFQKDVGFFPQIVPHAKHFVIRLHFACRMLFFQIYYRSQI